MSSVRNLGIFIDTDLVLRILFSEQSLVASPCSANCVKFAAVFQTLVVALVLSRLDYGNGVPVGLPAHPVRRLQLLQNAAARLIYNLWRSHHFTDVLICLHWLRIPERSPYCPSKFSMGAHRVTSDLSFVSPIFLVDKPSSLLAPAAWWCHLSS
jgi:hypothetical protein